MPLTITYDSRRGTMTVAGRHTRVTAEGALKPGRYNIGAPSSQPGVGQVAMARVPASALPLLRQPSMSHARGTTIDARHITKGTTVDARQHVARGTTVDARQHVARGLTVDARHGGLARGLTVDAKTAGSLGPGMVDVVIAPYDQRVRLGSRPAILLKTGGHQLMNELRSAGGAVLLVR